jgi:hypothetical protein
MADETTGPADATAAMPTPRARETTPGRTVDMSAFEAAFAGAPAAGPILEWALRWPSGHVLVVLSEDEALSVARANPTCRIVRRYATPWQNYRTPPDAPGT